MAEQQCPDGLTPDGPTCPRCGGHRGPSGIDGGTWVHCPKAAIPAAPVRPPSAETLVRDLLWNEHSECCGKPVVGAEYMGSQEMICCGCPEFSLLTDAQIVASLRALFPAPASA